LNPVAPAGKAAAAESCSRKGGERFGYRDAVTPVEMEIKGKENIEHAYASR